MEVDDLAPELANLSTLESRLLATRYPFMKLLALLRGRQSGIKGSVVNVHVSASQVCEALPHTPNSAGLVPLKLKRKMQYRSTVSYQHIRPGTVREALAILHNINPFYSNIQENSTWKDDCWQEDNVTWTLLIEEDNYHTQGHMEAEDNMHDAPNVATDVSQLQGVDIEANMHDGHSATEDISTPR